MVSLRILSLWMLLVPLNFCLELSSGQQQQQQQVLSTQAKLRNATIEDALDIAESVLRAFAPSDHYKYMYPHLDEYLDEMIHCMASALKGIFTKSHYLPQVVTMPDIVTSVEKPIAFGIWEFPGPVPQFLTLSSLAENCSEIQQRAGNDTRMRETGEYMDHAKKEHLDSVFGTNQLYLAGLSTHPDYQGHGAGSMLLRSGLAMAKTYKYNATLIATIEGEPVYAHMGFKSMTNITIPSDDGGEGFRYDVMYHDY